MDTVEIAWTLLLFVAVAQGLFLAAVLATSSAQRSAPTRLLAALTLIFALMIGEELVDITGLYASWPHALLSTFSLPLAIGPLVLFYARRLVDPSRRMRSRELWHFLPMVLIGVYLAPFYLTPGTEKLDLFDSEVGPSLDPLVVIKGAHVLTYLVVALIVCSGETPATRRGTRLHLLWFRRLLLATLAPVALIHVFYFLPGPIAIAGADSDRFGSVVIASLIYAFAFAAMRRPFFWGAGEAVGEMAAIARATSSQPKYRTSPLGEARKRAHLDALLRYMDDEQPFRDPEIGLDDVAEALSVSPHALSQVINEMLGVNFYAFMNDYRVEMVKRRMGDPAQRHRTLLALAFDAGFNSKTSFNRVFKERTGSTPSQYRRRLEGGRAPEHDSSAATGRPAASRRLAAR